MTSNAPPRPLTLVLVFAISAWPVSGASAQEFFAEARDFTVEKPCSASRSIKRSSEETQLQPGASYTARGVNRANDPTHVLIRVGEASKWVDLSCGRFKDAAPAAAKEPASGHHSKAPACLPFFDEVDNKVTGLRSGGSADITPPPPHLDDFDRAVLKACGPVGKSVSAAEFRTLLRTNVPVLDRLRSFTGGKVFAERPAAATSEAYLDALTEAWMRAQAFDHIFCGEPGSQSGKIGGLHFHGRYLELQQAGTACRMNNITQNEVSPGAIYTMGVIMRRPDGSTVQDARKGYGLTLSAEEILKVATKALSENPTIGQETSGCILSLKDDGMSFSAVFVRRPEGVRTFYPDATPNGRGDRQNPPCKSPINLQSPPG